jgi:hypothetical protein
MSFLPRFTLIIICCFTLAQLLYAPPPGSEEGHLNGYLWTDRATAYAQDYCGYIGEEPLYNDDYGPLFDADCAHFASQIAQAGCAGLAETNNCNWPLNEYYTPGNNCDCWPFHEITPDNNYDDDCVTYWEYGDVDCHEDGMNHPWFPSCYFQTGNHTTIISAEALWRWFLCNALSPQDTPGWWANCNVGDIEHIPDYFGPGSFGFIMYWDWIFNIYWFHSVYFGADYDAGELCFYAHTNNRCCQELSTIFESDNFEMMWMFAPSSYSELREIME